MRHRLAQSGHELVGREAGRTLEQPVAHARPGDGGEAQDGLSGRAQRLDAQHERIGDVGRQALAGGGSRQLLGEERVALGAREELVHQARLGPAPEDPGELRDDLLAREALQCDALDDRGALGLRHQRPQGMAAVQLVGAVCRDEQHALVARVAHEEGQEVARGAVRPVDVLEDEHQRLRLGQPSQEGEQELEHATLRERALDVAGLRRVELGQQRREARRAPPSSPASRPRSALTIGAYASSPSPRSTQSPVSTRAPCARARVASSATRRVLPTPDSPETSATAGRPSAARSSAADRPASSRSRPTNSGLVTRCVS